MRETFNPHGNGTAAAVQLEHRLTNVERRDDMITQRLDSVETTQREHLRREKDRDRVITRLEAASNWTLKELASVRELVTKLQADQQRFVLGAALGLGGLLLQVGSFALQALKAKLGF